MNKNISSRHQSDLGGTLSNFGAANRVNVTVKVAPDHAADASVQHSAWMLVNLLSRLEGVVGQVGIQCPKDVPLAGRIVPLAKQDLDLRTALLEGGTEIGVVPIRDDIKFERTMVVGADHAQVGSSLYLWSNGWCGGISPLAVPAPTMEQRSVLPTGPYIAACLAAGEVFKFARLKQYAPCGPVFYSLWNHCTSTSPIDGGPGSFAITLDAALAGVGAVGNACLHALWATPGIEGKVILADNDEKGLDESNLNRYVLFGKGSVGVQKAVKAAEILSAAPIDWQPHNKAFEEITPFPSFVLSAVDINTSRISIQSHYPARLFSASTADLRAEVLRCGPPGVGACLACFNKPTESISDDVIRGQAKKISEDQLQAIAEANGFSLADAQNWIETGKCGTAGEALLHLLRVGEGDHPFAVGFVSVMAGIMLAAEAIKEHLAHDTPLNASAQKGVFQFVHPLASTNRARFYHRDEYCSACNPASPAVEIWKRRYDS